MKRSKTCPKVEKQQSISDFFKSAPLKTKSDALNDVQLPSNLSGSTCAKIPGNSPRKKKIKVQEETYDSMDDDFPSQSQLDHLLSLAEISQGKRPLDMVKLKRYRVEDVARTSSSDLKLSLSSVDGAEFGVCFVQTPWVSHVIEKNDIISARGKKNEDGQWIIDWSGLVVTSPDHLVTGTAVVGSLYCKRRSVLGEIFQEIGERDCTLMVIGSLVHEIFQEALSNNINSTSSLEKLCLEKLENNQFKFTAFLENLNYGEVCLKVKAYVPQILEFMIKYVPSGFNTTSKANLKDNPDNWKGVVCEVMDIEENIWSPDLGIKGKVDATLRVKTLQNKTKVMPLELKTGKVSHSLEHRGQVILYCMLLKELGEFVDSGLLLYLKDEVSIREVRAGECEVRDLTQLRNELARYLKLLKQIDVVDLSPNTTLPTPHLPEPINRSSCGNCGHLVACCAALKSKGYAHLKDDHNLKKLVPEATQHLAKSHIAHVFHWVGLQTLENETSSPSSLSRIWSTHPSERENNGLCYSDMVVSSSETLKGAKFLVTFVKTDSSCLSWIIENNKTVLVSRENRLALTFAFVHNCTSSSLVLTVDRPFKVGEGPYYIDKYESTTASRISMSNLTLFFENNERGKNLREIIIDQKTPKFLPKIPKKVMTAGKEQFEKLNKEQIRAILQVVSAESYILIQGMPGTGKTTTMRALIEILVKLGQRVLVTSFTHSAIDNILRGLDKRIPLLRIGPRHRVHAELQDATEDKILERCDSVEKLEEAYSSRRVVGVTCLGAATHPWLERQTFDLCLVDEATQVTQPALLKAIYLAKKFVLVGDPKQLPPLVINKNAKKLGLGVSLFEHLDRPAVTSKLTLQYRMNEVITGLANSFSYDNELKCASVEVATATVQHNLEISEADPPWKRKALSTDLTDSLVVVDVDDDNDSDFVTRDNLGEANMAINLIEEFTKAGISASSIGVIATYAEQVKLVNDKVKQNPSFVNGIVEVNTVDQFQGRDKDIILFTTSKTRKYSDEDILSDTNRLTVAITRAKKKFILIGKVDFLKKYNNFVKLFSCIPEGNFVKI